MPFETAAVTAPNVTTRSLYSVLSCFSTGRPRSTDSC